MIYIMTKQGIYISNAPPYDNHFIGMNPDFVAGKEAWFALCSCGGPAVIVGYNAYAMVLLRQVQRA